MKSRGVACLFFGLILTVFGDDYSGVFTRELQTVNRYTVMNNDYSGKYLTVPGACSNDAPIGLQSLQTGSLKTNQWWLVNEVGPEVFRITPAVNTNFALRMASTANGFPLQIYSWSGWDSQKWKIGQTDGVLTRFRREGNFSYITATNGTDAVIHTWLPSAQEWTLKLEDAVSSPTIIRSPNGDLLAYIRVSEMGVSCGYLYASVNDGTTWSLRKVLGYSPYSPSLFTMDGNLYMAYCGTPNFRVLKSVDNGSTWTSHLIKTFTEVLESGGSGAVSINNGYIYYGFMDEGSGGRWGENYRLIVGSCVATTVAITNGSNWTFTDPLAYPAIPAVSGDLPYPGWLEPNCIEGPDGQTWVYARVENNIDAKYAAAMRVSTNRMELLFNNQYPAASGETGFLYAPWAGRSKFRMNYDATSAKWLVMSNPHMGAASPHSRYSDARNVLALYESADLWDFELVKPLITDDFYEDWDESAFHSGFQDPAFIIDGNDLRYVARTAYRSLWSYHDANKGTYHELLDFRDHLSPDGEIVKYTFNNSTDPGGDSSKMGGSHADLSGPAWSSSGKFGGCLVFDGTNDILQLMHRVSPKLHRTGQVSLSVWIKNDAYNGTIFSSAINDGGAGLDLMVDAYGYLKVAGRSDIFDSFQGKSFAYNSTGLWHHVVAMWDFENDAVRLWLDGVEKTGAGTIAFGSAEYTRNAPMYQDTIGGHYNGSSSPFAGALDELHIYNRALSAGEIADLYSGNL